MSSHWLDFDACLDGAAAVGMVGFLIAVKDTSNGGEKLSLRSNPARGNRSGDPILYGWAGETNNRSVYGMGLAKIDRIAHTGRVHVTQIGGDDLRTALEEHGYPDLMPE